MTKATTTKKKKATKSGSSRRTAGHTDDFSRSPSQLTSASIEELSDWRGDTLARLRAIITQAVPGVVEEVKWRKPSNSMRGVPVWSNPSVDGEGGEGGGGGGIICTGETYKNAVKLTFVKGASLADPAGLFNASLEGNTRRAIDFHEGDKINEKALKAIIRAAAALNTSVAGERAGGATARISRSSSSAVRSPKRPKIT